MAFPRSESPASLEPVPQSAPMMSQRSASLFIEHLEDATPSQEDMEAFDCFSPGSYISSRRQSVELAGCLPSPVSSIDGLPRHGYGSIMSSPALSPTSPVSPSSPRSPHARAYSQAAGMPFAALVRRLSYTSSRLPAKYSNRHVREGHLDKRPKTSSGPLTTLPQRPPSSTVFADGSDGDPTPIKLIQPGTFINEPLSANGASLSSNLRGSPIHPTPTRPSSRRRSKSGELLTGSSPSKSSRGKTKGHKRPNHPFRSISFMDEVLQRTPNSKDKAENAHDGNFIPVRPAQSGVLQPKNVNSVASGTKDVTPMTPDKEIEAMLAKHTSKRMSMPNLPTPPPTAYRQPSLHTPVEERRMSFDAARRSDIQRQQDSGLSGTSMDLRTPSPTLENISSRFSVDSFSPSLAAVESRSSNDQAKKERSAFTAGWPWHRRNSNSSLASLLSPRLGRHSSNASSPSLSQDIGQSSIGIPTSPPALTEVTGFGALSSSVPPSIDGLASRLDRMPSTNLPLRTSPLAHSTSSSVLDEVSQISKEASPGAVRGWKSRPGLPKRSLSTSFIVLGRKVASFGNNQAIDNAHTQAVRSDSNCLSTSAASGSAEGTSIPSPRRKDSGNSLLSPKSGRREWPWKSQSHSPSRVQISPSSPLSVSTASTPDVQWTYQVQPPVPALAPPAVGSPTVTFAQAKKPAISNASSPVFTRSPLALNTTNTYFVDKEMMTSELRPNLDNNAAHASGNLLSPERAVVKSAEQSFVVESRPRLYRNSKSDDGGLAGRSSASSTLDADGQEDCKHLSTSAPNAGRVHGSLTPGSRSPRRQVSPSPSRNLTKIPEADEHDLQTRRESWLASLRGRPLASGRRMSAAGLFGLPSPTKKDAYPGALPVEALVSPSVASPTIDEKLSEPAHKPRGIEELDFTKKPILGPNHCAPLAPDFAAPHQVSRTKSNPSSPQAESQALRSRAVSQSSLLSASRPTTPAIGRSSSSGLGNIRPFPVVPASSNSPILDAHNTVLQQQSHRHTQSMPEVPQVDVASLQLSGLGAPESSVANAAHAKFVRVLSATTAGAHHALSGTPVSTPRSKVVPRPSISTEDKEAMKRAMKMSSAFEHAVEDDTDIMDALESNDRLSTQVNDLHSPELRRTPKLSYATSSSAGSDPSTSGPHTEVRYRIIDTSTPVRAEFTSQQVSLNRMSPSNRTSSSMSNPDGPLTAFDILLSGPGMGTIDGMPHSKVHDWARRDASDDSQITVSSGGAAEASRGVDVFDEGRVSVW